MTPLSQNIKFKLEHSDALTMLQALPDCSIDSCVTDPPYGLGTPPDALEMLRGWLSSEGVYDHPNAKGFMGACVHPDTEVLTSKGWRNITKVKIGELIASLNTLGGIDYVPVIKTHEYDFKGDLFKVGGRSALQLVTPNHNVLVNDKLIRADSLPKTFTLRSSGVWAGNTCDTFFAGDYFSIKPFLYFLGLFLGDGSVCTRKAQPEKQDFISISVFKSRKIIAIRNNLLDLGVKFTETKSTEGRTTFYIYNKKLLEWLRPLGKALNKYIPDDILMLSPELLQNLWDGLMDTDGCIQGKNQKVYHTSSYRLAGDIQRLVFHLGGSGTVATHREEGSEYIINGRSGVASESYRISVTRNHAKFWMERDGRSHRNQPKALIKKSYEGKVYCVTLASNHIMLTRFEGKPVFTGNSWDNFVPQPKLWKEVLRVLKPGGYILCFAGARTLDLMGLSLRIAGFIPVDCLMWVNSQGMPKGLNISKAFDADNKAVREVIGVAGKSGSTRTCMAGDFTGGAYMETTPTSEEAKTWDGWNTQIKPAHEPIILARKPLEGTYIENIRKWGVGALNIDANRIKLRSTGEDPRLGGKGSWKTSGMAKNVYAGGYAGLDNPSSPKGKYPTNVMISHTDHCLETVDPVTNDSDWACHPDCATHQFEDPSKSRFFYQPKSSKEDRAKYCSSGKNTHITVKPIQLMETLVSLVTPVGGAVLDPFTGSGTTGIAALHKGLSFLGSELDDSHFALGLDRLTNCSAALKDQST